MPTVTCLNCNAIFKSKRSTAKFCSDKCRVSFSRKYTFIDVDGKKIIATPTGKPVPINLRIPKESEPIKAQLVIKPPLWAENLLGYCEKEGITPEDLIVIHKRLKKSEIPHPFGHSYGLKKSKEKKVEVSDLNEKAKPKGGYDPFKNPIFKSKHGIKE